MRGNHAPLLPEPTNNNHQQITITNNSHDDSNNNKNNNNININDGTSLPFDALLKVRCMWSRFGGKGLRSVVVVRVLTRVENVQICRGVLARRKQLRACARAHRQLCVAQQQVYNFHLKWESPFIPITNCTVPHKPAELCVHLLAKPSNRIACQEHKA